MGRDVFEGSEAARHVFAAADEALGFPLSRLCFEGPADELTRTINAQPAIMTVSLACLAAALEAGALAERPAALAGHSLGEYTALVIAGSLSLEEGLRLVRERGRLMQEASERHRGGLVAIVGLDLSAIEAICGQTGTEVCNCNSAEQTVIGGPPEALDRAMAAAKEAGAKRVAPLAVSGAFHSSLMRPAAEGLRLALERARIEDAAVPVIANSTAEPLTSAAEIRDELGRQVDHRLLWQDSIERLADMGVRRFIEIGPGKVLTGLVRRIVSGAELQNLNDMASIAGASP